MTKAGPVFLATVSAAIAAGCGGGSAGRAPTSPLCQQEEAMLDALMEPVALENGLVAAMYPSRPRYRSGEQVDVHLDLHAADGSPVLGRVFEALVMSPVGGETGTAVKTGLSPNADQPWIYDGWIQPATTWHRVAVVVAVGENADVNNPGATGTAQVQADITAPGSIITYMVSSTSTGIAVRVVLKADLPVHAVVQLDVTRTDGTALGSFFGAGELAAGSGSILVPVPAGEISDLAQSGGLVVSRAALDADNHCSDLLRTPTALPPL